MYLSDYDYKLPLSWFYGAIGLGEGWKNFFVQNSIIIVVAWIFFPKKADPSLKKKMRILLWLPSIWLLEGLWSGWFPSPISDVMRHKDIQYPNWVFYPIYLAFLGTPLISAYLIWHLKGARWFTAWITLANFAFVAVISFCCVMNMSGAVL